MPDGCYTGAPHRWPQRPQSPSLALLDRRLLVFTGKGGVGKSTISAAVALQAARLGKRVLACEVNADDRIPALLGERAAGPGIARLRENLWSVNVRPHAARLEYGLMKLRYPALVHAVLENRLIRYFLKALPSLPDAYWVGTNPASVAVGDFNGDGKPDLAVANSIESTVSVLIDDCGP